MALFSKTTWRKVMSSMLYLGKNADRRLKKGHLWIYSNEVDTARSPLKILQPGDVVSVHSHSGQFLGQAMMNPQALICGRVFSHTPDELPDQAFFAKRLQAALALRERCFAEPCYRLVFGDADFLPGVVIDRFGDYCVVQLATAGMDLAKQSLLAALDEILQPTGVVMRNNHGGRDIEDLPDEVEVLGQVPDLIGLFENGTRFEFAATTGQKTGWFYDHRPNRAMVQRLARGARVLDMFSYIGGWGIQAAQAGASHVLCVDSSQPALDSAVHNASLNGLADRVSATRCKAIDVMKALVADGETFDIVILDPPAFIRKRKDQKAGESAYRHINELAVRLLGADGILVSASCSMPLTDEMLTHIVHGAMHKQERDGQLLHLGGQGMDHPVHPAIPETRYIKAQFFRVL
jgi:23S rRNA (cytosine1962-C5)-methyltransferase